MATDSRAIWKKSSVTKLNFQSLMEVVASGRGSEEGRRLANIFQQVAADCKVNLQQRFSQHSLPKMMFFWPGQTDRFEKRGCLR